VNSLARELIITETTVLSVASLERLQFMTSIRKASLLEIQAFVYLMMEAAGSSEMLVLYSRNW
jgi:hypothetical protein